MKITKEEALELLDLWMEKSNSFPKHDTVIKIPRYGGLGEKETIFEEYTFNHLICVAYDLQPKQEI